MSTVTRGSVVVDTMTSPGYAKRVACTSMWQSLVHEMDAGVVELELGVRVCTIVVGTSSVVVKKAEEVIVDTIVEPGSVLVMT